MKLTKKLLTTAILGFSLAFFHSTAWADTVEEQLQQALEAAEKEDYQTAFNIWQPLAEQGNAIAQGGLGVMYENGDGVKQDYFEAVKWYQKSAEQGHPLAQYNLAGKAGSPMAEATLGRWYFDGNDNIQQDWEKAFIG